MSFGNSNSSLFLWSMPRCSAGMLALCLSTASLSVFIGCESDVVDRDKSLPAPLPEKLPYEFYGKVFRVWGGDYFDLRVDQSIHYVCLEGIDSPKHGQPFADKAREELQRIAGDCELRIVVKWLDKSKTAFVRAWVPAKSDEQPEIDIGLELIKRGFGWYDGSTFDGDAEYQSAEAKARQAKLGLWSRPNPIPPWDYDAAK